RLGGCGADAALVELARHCLQPEKQDRPRDAGEVARAVTAYQDSVQARLRQAEVEEAAAEARAAEEQRRRQAEQARAAAEQARARIERQRRRLAVALGAALVLLAAGAGGAGWWYQQGRLERAQEQAQLDAREAAQQAEAAARQKYLNEEVA